MSQNAPNEKNTLAICIRMVREKIKSVLYLYLLVKIAANVAPKMMQRNSIGAQSEVRWYSFIVGTEISFCYEFLSWARARRSRQT